MNGDVEGGLLYFPRCFFFFFTLLVGACLGMAPLLIVVTLEKTN